MKLKADVLRKCQFPLVIALGSWPVSPVLLGFVNGALLRWAWVFPVTYFILACIGLVIPGKRRLLYGVGCVLALTSVGVLIMMPGGSWQVLILSGVYSGLLLWSLQIGGWSREQEVPQSWIYGGIGVQVIAQLALIISRNREALDLDRAVPGIVISFLVFVLLVMLSMNRATLASASVGSHKVSSAMGWKNMMLILVLFLLALAITLMPVAADLAASLWRWFGWLIGLYGKLFGGDPQTGETPASEPEEDREQLMGDSSGDASQLALVLQNIVLAAATVLLIVIFAVAVYRLLRKALKLLRRLYENVNRYVENVAEDYVDEITDTRDSHDQESPLGRRSRRRIPWANEPGLTPGQRIRRDYLHLRLAHRRWRDASTARDNLPEELAELYERARYSGHPMTEQEAVSFRKKSKDI